MNNCLTDEERRSLWRFFKTVKKRTPRGSTYKILASTSTQGAIQDIDNLLYIAGERK